ncbi:MAG TPA: phosphoenolpyruvate--protein phosphotransferase [Thiotrichales bacterium]|nr:phosphoenolpyruvate--protein phosphotransferase [Thiotrichales bacterium]
MSLSLNGIGVSRGIAIGKVHLLERGEPDVVEQTLSRRAVEREVTRFEQAVATARQQLRDIRERIPASTSSDIAAFIDTHLLMLEDSALTTVPAEIIRNRRCNAEWALKLQRDALVRVFEEMDDPYLRTRKDDVGHVVNRIQRILLHADEGAPEELANLQGAVIVADDLTPADTALLQHQGMAAFVTEYGAALSHTAIMARSLRIPAVVGVHYARRYLRNGELVIVDGDAGVVIAEPDAATLAHYRKKQRRFRQYLARLQRLRHEPAITKDGVEISLQTNIELPEDVEAMRGIGAAGVGLYRTEFLFMNRTTLPDEEEQFEAYRAVVQEMDGQPVTIRTLDLGADKQTVEGELLPGPVNPALGLRAVRLCLRDPGLFRPQLRAILRAATFGPVRIMIPMLSNLQEIHTVKQLLTEVKAELEAAGIPHDPHVPLGGMVEVPAAAICAETFARHMDFLSIGTNDLIQYTLAIDRIDDEVNYLYDPLHPAVLKLINITLEAGRATGTPVSMCGEMAGDRRYTRLLLGLGLREFSMHPATLLEVKRVVRKSRISTLAHQAHEILRCKNTRESGEMLAALNKGLF